MVARLQPKGIYCLCPIQEKKSMYRRHVQAMGATAEPVNLLLLLEDQISKSTFLKEMNRFNEREPKLRANFLET